MGYFKSDEHEIYYCRQDILKRNGVAFICNNKLRRCVMGFNPINITVVQIYAPTSSSEEKYLEYFYETVQSVIEQKPSGDSVYIIGDWNAKVGKDISNSITGNFGLWERNERDDQLVEFFSRNDLQIMNTFFKLNPRRLYT